VALFRLTSFSRERERERERVVGLVEEEEAVSFRSNGDKIQQRSVEYSFCSKSYSL
jgi:hypothetical protein